VGRHSAQHIQALLATIARTMSWAFSLRGEFPPQTLRRRRSQPTEIYLRDGKRTTFAGNGECGALDAGGA
jgi:hypothetical protein